MPTVYVAKSSGLQKWAADVGLTKHVYKLGVSDGGGARAVAELNQARCAGRDDWGLIKARAVDAAVEDAAIERLAAKETMVEPRYYPQIKGARGIFKVKLGNVENTFLVERALAGEQTKAFKVTPALIGEYLIRNAAG